MDQILCNPDHGVLNTYSAFKHAIYCYLKAEKLIYSRKLLTLTSYEMMLTTVTQSKCGSFLLKTICGGLTNLNLCEDTSVFN